MIQIKSALDKEVVMITTQEGIRIEGLITEALLRVRNEGRMPKPFFGVRIIQFGGFYERFQSCVVMLLSDPHVFETFVYLASKGVFVRITGQWGEWIALDSSGAIVIRCDISIHRVRVFFEIEEEKST